MTAQAAQASIRGDGATRDGDPPVVQLVLTVPPPSKPRVHRATFAYGRNAAQRLDAYWTSGGQARRPGVLLFHGGYWWAGDKLDWRATARRLAARGYAVFSANYRLTSQAPWPAQGQDAAAALGYIQRHAGRFRLDPNRMVLLGSSAGGQLATMLGASGAGRVRGGVALSPVNSPYLAYLDGARPDATPPQRKLRRAIVRLVGCRPTVLSELSAAACVGRMRQAAPRIGAGAVPMLFIHSRGDFVPVTHSVFMRDALTAAGVTATVKRVRGSAHGGALLHGRVYSMVVAWIEAITSRDG
jgi:acetyl esterase/lipase